MLFEYFDYLVSFKNYYVVINIVIANSRNDMFNDLILLYAFISFYLPSSS